MLKLSLSSIVVTLMVASVAAQAQTATPRIDQREATQQKRIDQGVASGQLNARETNRLDKQEASVQRSEARAKADGVVTSAERKRLRNKQNAVSRNIHQQKHDAQTAH